MKLYVQSKMLFREYSKFIIPGINFAQRYLLSRFNMLKVEFKQYGCLISGEIKYSLHQRFINLINPSNGKVFAQAADLGLQDFEDAIDAAKQTADQGMWSSMTVAERGIYLKKLAALIRENARELADLESMNCGKTLKQTTFIDIPACADTFDYFSNISPELAERENKIHDPVQSKTVREPMGVVACIIPWNYPLVITAWKIAPALIAGNCVILKPSSLACVSVLRLAELMMESDFPKGVIQVLTTTDHRAAQKLVEDSRIDMLSFTGGTETGQKLMALASKTVKKISFELGGKSPNIIFDDCDREAALGGSMSAIFMNQGAMCTAGSRLLVDEKIYDQFVGELVERAKGLKIGDAMDYQTNFGPMISREHRDKISGIIHLAVSEGAQVLCGGQIPEAPDTQAGFFIEPTILGNVSPEMSIFQEEVFGPVLTVTKFSSEESAIRLANDSKYGLACCIWTRNVEKAERVAKQIKSGIVWINTYGGFYNEASFGGYKQSGSGRELGVEGLLEFTQSKHICADASKDGKPLVANWF